MQLEAGVQGQAQQRCHARHNLLAVARIHAHVIASLVLELAVVGDEAPRIRGTGSSSRDKSVRQLLASY
jgi:hypothetical protein